LKVLKSIGDFDDKYKSILGVIDSYVSQFYLQFKSQSGKQIKQLTDNVNSMVSDNTLMQEKIQSLEKKVSELEKEI
jgi:polyhydroxyalkanoate synthesis regulator phasin